MSEEKLSNKLDIEGAQRSSSSEENIKESYKPISEDIGLTHVSGETVKNSNMVRENSDPAPDGADEKMLDGDDKEALALKGIEVKFITGDQNQNGDAKIDIGNIEKTFTGMTKEELMKYANDPFWVRLRWILFILFWAVWIAMLLGAIAIIVYAPKCAEPTPLVWWKTGPLVTVGNDETPEKIQEIKDFKARGVIVELSPDETYLVDTEGISQRIKKLVENYNAQDLHVVMDLTANYVSETDPAFQEAISSTSTEKDDFLSAFVTHDQANNWKKVNGAESAWKKHGNRFFLTQFGNHYDLQMSSPVAQQKLKNVLEKLIDLGVKGFRLANAKHFIISSSRDDDKPDTSKIGVDGARYEHFQHLHTTNQPGLGDVIRIFTQLVHNKTGGEGFLTIRDDASERMENYVIGNSKVLGFDLPRLAFLNNLVTSKDQSAKFLHSGFALLNQTIDLDTLENTKIQIPYDNLKTGLDASAYDMFMTMMPGVKIGSLENLKAAEASEKYQKLQDLRKSAVFQFGTFDVFLSKNETAFGYTRVKPGNPGYFVAVNPTNNDIKADFTDPAIGSELSVVMMSGDASLPSKVSAAEVELPKHTVGIFTFVPK